MYKFGIYLFTLAFIMLFSTYVKASNFDELETACLAEAIYFESRGEELEGQIAVGLTIINRSKSYHRQWPTTICGVVDQKIKGTCQFSYRCEGRREITDARAWLMAVVIAKNLIVLVSNLGENQTHFHTTKVNPWWSKKLTVIKIIGNHIFYK